MSNEKIDTSNGNALATQPKIERDTVFIAHLLCLQKSKPAAAELLDDYLTYSQDGSVILDRIEFARYRESNRISNGKKVKQLDDEAVKRSLASNWSTMINQMLKKLNSKLPSVTTTELLARHDGKSKHSIFKDGRSNGLTIDVESEAKKLGLKSEQLADMLKMLGNI